MNVLFTPVRLGPLTLKNRLVMAPMGTCLDNGGYVTEDTVAYYRRRAEGGVGAITVEGCLVSGDTVGPEPRISGPEFVPGLRRIVEELEPFDVAVGVQLMHPGRQVVEGPSVAPSPVPLNSAAPVPHELTVGEIERIVEDYARAARFAREAGFTYLEVHGAHGYLPSNFLSPQHNHRTDAYGGTLENRARFSVEIARAIGAACDLPLVWRLNGTDAEPGGFDPESAVAVAGMIERAGAASISVSSGTWLTLQQTLAPMSVPRGHMLDLVRAVKKEVSVPVMAVGRLDDPDLAEAVVEQGDADMVLLGRGLIAEPDWPLLVRDARRDELRPCIACNACVDLVGRGERARCAVNPEVGRELTWAVEPAARLRRVMVVGSGPAGLEAARLARLRGHEVSVWERDPELGGKLTVAGLAPSKHEVLRFRDHQIARLAALGVELHTSAPVTARIVKEQGPDVLIVATGADPLVPPIPGIDGPTVHDAQRFLRGEVEVPPGTRLVVVGGSATGCETAELMRAGGAEVTVVEMRRGVGRGIEAITRRQMVRQLRHDGVELLVNATVVDIEPGLVRWRATDGAVHELPADLVALAIGWRPTGSSVLEDLEPGDIEVRVLGDADSPADFVRAINAGADAALAL
ncbi:NAD(P)/FAD-dependent oxidoreductase [Pseudonocardia parietis]|uniref:2,4-dienoyl-CoA reductase-like NADH-dependent reductase (Old Yellow Enzyme family)/thioredoxin reductase n=1 Tax=Pseudonocardia parietis TaxID=570936 RepID=A0ABS4VV51_9PSEU|nr:NAD(P)/FAD-dependent oxidoreductase [Pseudonocardia parietis]MBP2367812.1 2,4-dienoyl-CoA reductase-like NADH-dependent reductase (Old Yellow Enzyme family)/thioredoxin reductase [Pseudonocardia parietis]